MHAKGEPIRFGQAAQRLHRPVAAVREMVAEGKLPLVARFKTLGLPLRRTGARRRPPCSPTESAAADRAGGVHQHQIGRESPRPESSRTRQLAAAAGSLPPATTWVIGGSIPSTSTW